MRRLISAAVHNPVATNILMLVLIVSGGWSVLTLTRETLPQLSFDIIQVSVVFDGATPEDVEEGVVIKIEEAISGIEGIRKVSSSAFEDLALVWAELEPRADNRKVLDDIKDEVDKIETFPDDAKTPRVVELTRRRQVINIAVFGDQPERVLKETAHQIRDDLMHERTISQVEISGTRDYEITIEVSEAMLRRYHLTFEQIRDTVRRSSLNLPAGDLKTATRDIVVRTSGQRYTAAEFASIPVVTHVDGTVIRLGDIAQVFDGFEEADQAGRFNGQAAVLVSIFKTNEEDALAISKTVRHYVETQNSRLPPGLSLNVWADSAPVINGRLRLLTNNGLVGLILVFLCLWLFLNLRLAFWVAAGLPVAFMGAFWLLDLSGATLNMITMFACIMALGILVDDAIVVGENIYAHWQRGKSPIQAAIDGTQEVLIPVVSAVLTTVAAFLPLFTMEGILGKFIAVLPVTMVAALMTSLLEVVIILPPHLAHSLPKHDRVLSDHRFAQWMRHLRQHIDHSVKWCITRAYLPLLMRALSLRLVVLAGAVAILMIMRGLVQGGHIEFLLLPKADADTIIARLTLPQGTPLNHTLRSTERLEASARQLNQLFQIRKLADQAVVQRIMTVVGRHSNFNPEIGSHAGEVTLELMPVERRGITSQDILSAWRRLTGDIPEALALTFGTREVSPGGPPIEVRLIGDHYDDLRVVADRVKAELSTYPGVLDIQDDFRPGKMQAELNLKPAGLVLGLTLDDLARQVRYGLFGAEALRLQRGRDDVRVMIRYPVAERRALGDLERIRIRMPDGAEAPFTEVATVTLNRGYALIKHVDRQRVVTVTADVDTALANAEKVLADLGDSFLPPLLAKFERLRYSFEGQHHETQRSVKSLYRGFVIAMLLIYGILATVFRSYLQPLIVMSVIPFGLIGAILGHLIMGHDLTMMSLFGLVALSGVVVNDALVLIDVINRNRNQGVPVVQAVLNGGQARFRAIFLTTLTTVAGLLPILAEKSFQAQFLIPMAISISFGLVGATFLTLFLVPALYLLLHDLQRIIDWLRTGQW
ncbi:MAG: efflux RND transporter permease subunit, partial [bacterium]|nr:efflux RND transporter permease subunit [bacterium]